MDHLSIQERAKWLSSLITRELQRFEADTGVMVDDVRVGRIDKRLTSVSLNIDRRFENA